MQVSNVLKARSLIGKYKYLPLWIREGAARSLLRSCSPEEALNIMTLLGHQVSEQFKNEFRGCIDVGIEHIDEIAVRLGFRLSK